MALPSQTARGGGGRSSMASRARRNLRPAMAAGAVVVLGGAVAGWMLWGGPNEASGKPEPAAPLADAGTDAPNSPAEPKDGALAIQGPAPAVSLIETKPTPVEIPQSPGAAARNPAPATVPPKNETPPPAPARVVEDYPVDLQGTIRAADDKIAAKDLVTARELFNRALHNDKATEDDKASLRERIAKLNEQLVFSPTIFKDDPLTEVYEVRGGDSLTKIVPRQGLAVETGFVARVNRLSNPNSLRVGQKLKLVRGPFHAVVTKSAFRMDIYSGNPDEESDWMFIRSFTVGLGEDDSTPVGTFVVRRHSKLINPPWINPRTGEKFGADDPKNPIGERWLGLEGIGTSAAYSGYGIHGTIDPESVGQMKSMGCVRLGTADVEIVYDMLVEAISTVRIDP